MAKRKNRKTTKKPLTANKKYKDTVFRMLFSERKNLLSEAYENHTEEPNLELRVVTLNINEGHNRELMEQCQILREYAQYVAKVRNYTKEMELNAAVERAVNECIHEGILAEFLRMNRAEVIAMSIFEYDKEEEEKKLRKAEFEAGVAEGLEKGELKAKKEAAIEMAKNGMPEVQIASILKIEKGVVFQWLAEGKI